MLKPLSRAEPSVSFRSTSSRSPRRMPARRRTARRPSRPTPPASPRKAFCKILSSSRNWIRMARQPGSILSPSAKAAGWRSFCGSSARRSRRPIRSVIDTANDPHEISLDENVTRENMHPADQFEAFKKLAEERGFGAEEIAARFGVTPHVVRQRLRLGAVSPKLMQIYRDGDLGLDQLMAFAITKDHARQEAAFERLSHNRDASTIRRMLTETNVAATDRRAVFVGAEKYTEVGGTILHDLFTEDRGGYFEDVALLDMLVVAKLGREANALMEAEGWKWAQVFLDYPHSHGLRRTYPQAVDLSAEDQAALDAAQRIFGPIDGILFGAVRALRRLTPRFATQNCF